MVISDENNPSFIKPTNLQGESVMGSRKFGMENSRNNRRVLNVINQNFVYPRVVNKRALSEAHQTNDKNPPNPAHRPITRKFAAQIASTRQPRPEENKKSNRTSAHNFTVWEDCAVADVEEKKADIDTEDHAEPMSLEQTEEAAVDPKDQMEIEMEDIFEDDPIVDIDGCDSKNPLAVVDYVDDLYAYYRRMENSSRVLPNYMTQQFDINEKMRAILIDWLIEVHHKFELQEETLFLTVNLIDRFLAEEAVVRKKLQLVGLVAMLLACKYEEVSVPAVEDLLFISDRAYTRKEILDMERLMLNTLQFNMSVPTPYVFIKRYLKAAQSDKKASAQSDKKLELMSFFLVELCLVEYEMLRFPPSLMAAATVYAAQCTLYGYNQWTKTCTWHSTYSEHQLLECSKLIVSLHQKAGTGRLTGVHRKYSTSKLGFAAKEEPAIFLVEETQQQ